MKTWQKATFIIVLVAFIIASVTISFISMARALSDVRVQCMLIGLGFNLVGYVLMTLPYLFMWDFTDEKHAHVMEVLKQRAEAGNAAAERTPCNLQDTAVNAEAAVASQNE